MNLILILCMAWSRPAFTPIGPSDLDVMARREAELGRPAGPATSSAWDADDFARVPGRFVVGYEPEAKGRALAWAASQGAVVAWCDDAAGFLAVEFAPGRVRDDIEFVESIRQVPGIRYFEPDLRVRAAVIPNDPLFRQYQWDKWVMYADLAWDVAGSGQFKVAVVDNGVEYIHPDLAMNFRSGELGYDFVNNDDDPRPDDPSIAHAFHGTHVAGIIAATRDNNLGIAGWAPVQLLAVRVLDDSGSGNTTALASGIRWAADRGCRIINMSLGAQSASTPVSEACQYALDRNVLLVAASGNEGRGLINHPAALDQCIAVGWMSKDSRLSTYSNYGLQQELVAPGSDVVSSVPGGAYALASGTSMAAPQVAGVAALMLSADTTMSPARLRAVLGAAAIDMGGVGRDQTYGFGLLNARRAMDLAALVYRTACPAAPAVNGRASIVRGEERQLWAQAGVVYDASGRRVSPVNLKPGAYFVRSEVGGQVSTEKVLVLR